MLFNSYEFVFLFLPISLVGFFLIGKRGHSRIGLSWLVGVSLFFYAWWNPAYLSLIIASILFNYAVGVQLSEISSRRPRGKGLLVFGIVANLALLGYYKYANFFVDNLNQIGGFDYHLETVILPLAISFFTFQQITYLVDAYKGETREYNFLHYCLFVTFFPQLIAGPIVHHREMMPQFKKGSIFSPSAEHLAVGFTIFFIGLFKKVIVADKFAPYASEAFNAVNQGTALTFFEAWRGTLAYSFQLYFDFSGYSDMAIGLAYLFGIVLPLNFLSPYKAVNIIDFWRRWHMTLSRLLRDYIYIPLGGNKKGTTRRYVNLLLTMLIGGLWHGAAWTFVIWGGLHGVFLVVNHAWHALRRRLGQDLKKSSVLGVWCGRLITFIAVSFAWVVFRAEDTSSALLMYKALLGINGIFWPGINIDDVPLVLGLLGVQAAQLGYFNGGKDVAVILIMLLFVWCLPNTQAFVSKKFSHLERNIQLETGWLQWRPSMFWVIAISFVSLVALLSLADVSEFLYFQF